MTNEPEFRSGQCRIPNVGMGDLVVTFDKDNDTDTIRARRVIKDMLRRGFALLVEVERNGEKRFERARSFDEKHDRYIIADFDSEIAAVQDADESDRRTSTRMEQNLKGKDTSDGEGSTSQEQAADSTEEEFSAEPGPKRGRGRKRTSSVSAHTTRAVGVARSAGG